MKITCNSCTKDFEPSPPDEGRIKKAQSTSSPALVMLECPHCYSDIAFSNGATSSSEPGPYRCPVIGCAGWVTQVAFDSPPYLGCGECGSIWYGKDNFFRYIGKSIARYAYRANCYGKNPDGTYLPGEGKDEPANYEDLVESEPKEYGEEFVKG